MSDLAAAAAAIGAPEELVQRSAEARAAATGSSVDEIIAAWAGGGSAPAAAPPAADTPAPSSEPSEASAPAPAPADAAPAPAAPAPAAAPARAAVPPPPAIKDPDAAPLLVGRHESGGFMLFVIAVVVAVGALVAALAPAQAARVEVNDSIGAQPEFSTAGAEGREVYLREGCATCHTMLVRTVVTDAGLGPVTRVQDVAPLAPDTLGMRRLGPDLAHIGSRDGMSLGTVISFLEDPASVSLDLLHQPYGYLSDTELASLAQFIVETK
jgi:hypothetical protein